MTMGQCSFLKNSVNIGKIYWPNNNIAIIPISTGYSVNMDLILICAPKVALTQYSISDTQTSILTEYSNIIAVLYN